MTQFRRIVQSWMSVAKVKFVYSFALMHAVHVFQHMVQSINRRIHIARMTRFRNRMHIAYRKTD